jgi:hypothetical protein
MQTLAQQQPTQIHQGRTIELQRGYTASANASDAVDAQSIGTPGKMPRPAITTRVKQAERTPGHWIKGSGLVGLIRITPGARESQIGRIRIAPGCDGHDMLDAITTR